MHNGAKQLKISDASRQLGVPYQRLYVAVTAGEVSATRDKRGNRWLVDKDDLPNIAQNLGVESPLGSAEAGS